MKVLFVCLGNVARSQMAEVYYNYFTNSNEANSAGVLDFTPEKYGHLIKEVVDVMNEDNLDVSKQKVKYINKEMVNTCDKVFVMCKKEECLDFLLKSNKVTFWKIEDPFGSGLDNFRKIREEVKNKVRSIVK